MNMRHLCGNVPSGYVLLLHEYLARQGGDAAALLGAAQPQGPTWMYPAADWRQLLDVAATHLNDPVLGLRLGAAILPAHLGPLGYVLHASASLALAAERYLRYQRLVHDVSPLTMSVNAQTVVLEWGGESRSVGLLSNQFGLAALVKFARDITGKDVVPESVHFVEPMPQDIQPYRDFFRCPVWFSQSATRVHFVATSLALPAKQPDPALAGMLEQQVQAVLVALPQQALLVQEVCRLVAHLLMKGPLTLKGVAQALHISGRTLRRRLEAQGLDFRSLRDETRQRLAQEYLQDPQLALPEIAFLLGYSEQSAFNRAFLRWTGRTPNQWRRVVPPVFERR